MRFIPKVKFLNYSTLENEQTFLGKIVCKIRSLFNKLERIMGNKKIMLVALDGVLLKNFTDFRHAIETRVYKAHCFA
jgi:hypothetical protein